MKSLKLLFLATLVTAQIGDELKGSKVFNIYPNSSQQRIVVGQLENVVPDVDVWQKSRFEGSTARVLVPAESISEFESYMKENEIDYDVSIDDARSVLEMEVRQNVEARKMTDGRMSFTAFHRHAEINAYLDELARLYPDKVEVRTEAVTGFGNEIKSIRISSTGFQNASKPIILIDAGIHAREWIAPPVALYTIQRLVENGTEPDMFDGVDWIIYPVLNPDGYEYTHTTNRMWRKTMSNESSTVCLGVDGNRNYDYHWMDEGSSNDTCSDIYAGPRPFSEVEVRVIRDEVQKYGGRIKGYISIHSHGGFIIYPYATTGELPPNGAELRGVALTMARARDDHKEPGTPDYLVGNAAGECCPVCCKVSGSSMDYVVGSGSASLAYTFELPSGGVTGFDPPPTRIVQTVTETWPAIRALARHLLYPVK